MKKNKKSEEQKTIRKYANEVRLVGYLGDEPRQHENRVTISLATKTSWKPAGSDQWQDRTEWHRLVAWDKLAETVSALALQKGDHVEITGELRSRVFEPADTDTETKQSATAIRTWEIRARSVCLLHKAKPKEQPVAA